MELLLAGAIAVLLGTGTYLALRPRSFDVVLGITLMSYAVNLFIFAAGRVVAGRAPIVDGATVGLADPLPQALVLTAIVIGFAMTALLLVLALRARHACGTDQVDGDEETQ